MAIGYQRTGGPLQRPPSQDSLADILERVLDKGIVIAGDIQINLLDIELLTIKLRLIVASVDKAKEMGIDWWETDPMLNAGSRRLVDENHRLRERLAALERRLDPPEGGTNGALAAPPVQAREDRDA
jgi:Gas vesicle protein